VSRVKESNYERDRREREEEFEASRGSSEEPTWEQAYRNLREEWREKPVAYAKHRLGLVATHQQRDLLNAIREPGSKVTARSGHGTGKSAALAIEAKPKTAAAASAEDRKRLIITPLQRKAESVPFINGK